MAFYQLLPSLILATLAYTAATPQPKVLALPVSKKYSNITITPDTHGKRSTVNAPLDMKRVAYYVSLSVGTPPQEFELPIDTGSSDLWVSTGYFDPSKSSTWKDANHDFEISYVDGTGAKGELGFDTLTIAGATISDAEFASVKKSGGDGVFGISYSSTDDGNYPNVPAKLKSDGIIESLSYSLWLDDFNSEAQGTILFGGIDHARYEGTLGKLPVDYGSGYTGFLNELLGNHDQLSTILNGISLKSNSNGQKVNVVSDASFSVVIDSGTTTGVLPAGMCEAIAKSIPGSSRHLTSQGIYEYHVPTVPDGSIIFDFLGVEIEIPLSKFFDNDNVLGVNPDDSPLFKGQGPLGLLGDVFISNAYVVYDLETNEIAMANAKYGPISGSDIEAIGSDGIPGTKAPRYASTREHSGFSTTIATIF